MYIILKKLDPDKSLLEISPKNNYFFDVEDMISLFIENTSNQYEEYVYNNLRENLSKMEYPVCTLKYPETGISDHSYSTNKDGDNVCSVTLSNYTPHFILDIKYSNESILENIIPFVNIYPGGSINSSIKWVEFLNEIRMLLREENINKILCT
tara:strand:+ start:8300 stop:8758 length:459 start_codon:yes stop_codon:yes gene_type:complete